MNNTYYFYILTNSRNTVFYIGVTNNLERRLLEHKNKLLPGFTKEYNIDKLVYFEETNSIDAAIKREKQIKNWHRDWKINLIKTKNPDLLDISKDFSL